MKIVRDLVRRENLGVLWATHLIDEIEKSDRVVVMHKGQILYSGTVPGMLEHAGETNIRSAFNKLVGADTPDNKPGAAA